MSGSGCCATQRRTTPRAICVHVNAACSRPERSRARRPGRQTSRRPAAPRPARRAAFEGNSKPGPGHDRIEGAGRAGIPQMLSAEGHALGPLRRQQHRLDGRGGRRGGPAGRRLDVAVRHRGRFGPQHAGIGRHQPHRLVQGRGKPGRAAAEGPGGGHGIGGCRGRKSCRVGLGQGRSRQDHEPYEQRRHKAAHQTPASGRVPR